MGSFDTCDLCGEVIHDNNKPVWNLSKETPHDKFQVTLTAQIKKLKLVGQYFPSWEYVGGEDVTNATNTSIYGEGNTIHTPLIIAVYSAHLDIMANRQIITRA